MEMEISTSAQLSYYIANRLLQDVSAVETVTYDESKERHYRKLKRLLQMMMGRGASTLQYPPIRRQPNAVIQDMTELYCGIRENISIHSIRALVCIFTATFSMMARYRHRVDITIEIANFFYDTTCNLSSWDNFLSANYENCF